MGKNKTRIAYREDEKKNLFGRMWHYKHPMTEIRQKCSIVTFDIVNCIDAFVNCGDATVHFPNPQFPERKVFEAKAVCDKRDSYNYCTAEEVVDTKLNFKYHDALARKYKKIGEKLLLAAQEIMYLQEEHEAIANDLNDKYKKMLED